MLLLNLKFQIQISLNLIHLPSPFIYLFFTPSTSSTIWAALKVPLGVFLIKRALPGDAALPCGLRYVCGRTAAHHVRSGERGGDGKVTDSGFAGRSTASAAGTGRSAVLPAALRVTAPT